MKKQYEKPKFQLQRFQVTDVITASGEAANALKPADVTGGQVQWDTAWDATTTD